jgi:PIN domain nuclease of toxin-antitoxin system
LNLRLLADTHIVIWWLSTPKKLSREQERALDDAVQRGELVAISAMTLVEIAVAFPDGRGRGGIRPGEVLQALDSNPDFYILPVTVDVAAEVAAIGDSLRDPFDRTIVCTARVHRLRLITSDRRIIDSRLVPVIE